MEEYFGKINCLLKLRYLEGYLRHRGLEESARAVEWLCGEIQKDLLATATTKYVIKFNPDSAGHPLIEVEIHREVGPGRDRWVLWG